MSKPDGSPIIMLSGKRASGMGLRKAIRRITHIAAPSSRRSPVSRHLHPPTAPSWTVALANAQVSWFQGDVSDGGPTAAESGWRTLGASGGEGVLDDAITAANAGKLVIAGYFQPPTKLPEGTEFDGAGHIVIVRPQESFPSDSGPEVVTAGVRNFKSASMKFAFGDHPLAWPDNIQLFVHDTALE
jgi:hypothetical protein